MFGVIGEEIYLHSLGIDEADIHEIYIPKEKSLSIGQLLFKDYTSAEAELIIATPAVIKLVDNITKKHSDFLMTDENPVARSAFFYVRIKPCVIPDNPRYGLVATKKTFKFATQRNRAKRLLRDWIRFNETQLRPGNGRRNRAAGRPQAFPFAPQLLRPLLQCGTGKADEPFSGYRPVLQSQY